MFETIFELIKDPTNACNWRALIEFVLSLVALGVGLVAIICIPALAPLGVLVALIGVGGITFGHW